MPSQITALSEHAIIFKTAYLIGYISKAVARKAM